MNSKYNSIRKSKNYAQKYLEAGKYDAALNCYSSLGHLREIKRLNSYLNEMEGDKKAACKAFLRRKRINKLLLDFPIFISTGALIGALVGLAADSHYVREFINPGTSEERLPGKEEAPSNIPLGVLVGSLGGLYFSIGQLHDEITAR